jgi:MSHA biogenesis protein MshP
MSSTVIHHALPLPDAWRRAERGFSLVSAIFLLVVLAALAAAIVNVSTTQHTASALDVLGAQAYQAARAGAEWGLYRYRSAPAAYCNNAAASDTQTFALPAGATLASFSVTVSCTFTPYGGAATAAQPTQSITYNASTNVATVTTAAPHGIAPGYRIVMSGASPAAYNGSYMVDAIPSPTTFTYFPASAPGGAATAQGIFTASVPSLDRRQIIAIACNHPGVGGCPNASTRIDYVERQVQVEF